MVLFEGSCFVAPCETRSMGWPQKSHTFNTALSEKNLTLERTGWIARSSLIKVGLLLLRAILKLVVSSTGALKYYVTKLQDFRKFFVKLPKINFFTSKAKLLFQFLILNILI